MDQIKKLSKSLVDAIFIDETQHGGLLRRETLHVANTLKLEMARKEQEERSPEGTPS